MTPPTDPHLLKKIIIEWLGGRYSGDRDMGVNPDYFSSYEVDALVHRIERRMKYMDTRSGDIYPSKELAEAAGVPDEDLVTGSREALEKLKQRIVFTKGSFKPAADVSKGRH